MVELHQSVFCFSSIKMSDADKRFQEELETAKALSLESQAMEQFRFEVKVILKAELTWAACLYSVCRICYFLFFREIAPFSGLNLGIQSKI